MSRGPLRVALYGGSFDPPHVAHLMAAAWVLATRPVDRVWILPVARHAFGKPLTAFEHRVAMCRLGFACLGRHVALCTVEEELGPVNRTVDTLRHLRDRHPDHAFSLVVGTDVLAERHLWKDFDEIERTTPLHVIGRASQPGSTPEGAGPDLPDVSSSAIRARLREGAAVEPLVAARVLDYIRRHHLYR